MVDDLHEDMAAVIAAMRDERDAALRHIAEIEPDARRYRYLRDRDLDAIDRGGVFAGRVPQNVVINGDDLDAAIDAALAETV